MEAHIYVTPKDNTPYATDSVETAHILARPLLHISFPTGLPLERAIQQATAVTSTTGIGQIAEEMKHLNATNNQPNYKGTRPISPMSVGSIKLADDQLKTEQNPEKRQQAEERRKIALAEIITQFHEYFTS